MRLGALLVALLIVAAYADTGPLPEPKPDERPPDGDAKTVALARISLRRKTLRHQHQCYRGLPPATWLFQGCRSRPPTA